MFFVVFGLALGLVAVVAVGGGVEGVGALDLVLEVVALEGGVLAEVLDAADVLVLGSGLGLLDLSALDDRAGEWVDLTQGFLCPIYRRGCCGMRSKKGGGAKKRPRP